MIVATAPPSALAAKGCDHDDPDRLHDRRRSGRARPRREPQPAGRQRHGRELSRRSLGAKRLELLHELVPEPRRIAVLVNPNTANTEAERREVQAAAHASGSKSSILDVSSERDIDTAFATLVQRGAGALWSVPAHSTSSRREQIVALAARHAIPAIYHVREFAAAGGLMSYGASIPDALSPGWRLCRPHSQGREAGRPAGHAADKVRVGDQPQDRQGARPRNPRQLLALADEVIE